MTRVNAAQARAVYKFSGGPAAGFDRPMVGSAGEGEIVHDRDLASGVLVDVVHSAEITGYATTGCCAPTVLG